MWLLLLLVGVGRCGWVVVVRAAPLLLLLRWLWLGRVCWLLAEVRVGCMRCVRRMWRVRSVRCVWLLRWVVRVGWWRPVVGLCHRLLSVGSGGARCSIHMRVSVGILRARHPHCSRRTETNSGGIERPR